jgi:type II secretory pathway component PulK
VLAIVLVMIFALVTAVYSFQHRAIIDTTIATNRIEAAEADALARGGLRLAEVLLAIVRARQVGGADAGGGDRPGESNAEAALVGDGTPAETDALWQEIGGLPIELDESRSLRIEIEDESARLNLNALVPVEALPEEAGGGEVEEVDDEDGTQTSDEAIEYLTEAMQYVIDGMEGRPEDRAYDPRAIAENILDFMDGDGVAVNGRAEDEYYQRQDPPYRAWNRPLVSVDQLGLVEGIDPPLLEELRHYVTVHPVASTTGINLNRAEPWVLKLVYSGTSGNMRLIDDRLAEDIYRLRQNGKLVCDQDGGDPRCVPLGEIGSGELGNGSIYPAAGLPATPVAFRVRVTARVGAIERRFEATYDTRPADGPWLLSWRRLRGED